jgi:hypothetical protein
MLFYRGLGNDDSWKNRMQKISWHCPFNYIITYLGAYFLIALQISHKFLQLFSILPHTHHSSRPQNREKPRGLEKTISAKGNIFPHPSPSSIRKTSDSITMCPRPRCPLDNVSPSWGVTDRCVPTLDHIQAVGNHSSYSQKLVVFRVPWGLRATRANSSLARLS